VNNYKCELVIEGLHYNMMTEVCVDSAEKFKVVLLSKF